MDEELRERLARAAKRAAVHLVRAGIETLKAVEAAVIELRTDAPEREPIERIDVR